MYYRNKFLKEKIDRFCFPNEEVTEYIKKHNYLPAEKILNPIPFVFSDLNFRNNAPDNTVIISIIGAIDKRRRNYKEVLEAFTNLIPEIDKPVELKLLGRPTGIYGKKIIKKFQKLEGIRFKLTRFDSFVPQEYFEKHIESTHFLIIPVDKEFRYKIFKELPGQTKISGNVNDMIIYGKPALIPYFYPLPKELDPAVKKYHNSEGLKEALKFWIQTFKFINIDLEKLANQYSFSKMANLVADSLNQISNNQKYRK